MTTESKHIDVAGLWAAESKPIVLSRFAKEVVAEQSKRVQRLRDGEWPKELAGLTDAEKAEVLATAEKTLEKSKALVAAREKDNRFVIRVRHVGSPQDPTRWEEIAAEFTEADHACTVRARKLLLEEFGNPADAQEALGMPFKDAVAHRAGRLPERSNAYQKLINARLDHGLVGGQAERERLWALGGWRLQIEAHEEVRRFQEVTPELGED